MKIEHDTIQARYKVRDLCKIQKPLLYLYLKKGRGEEVPTI